MTAQSAIAFASLDDLLRWLAQHHAVKSELWVSVARKASGTVSVTWEDCVIAGLVWGWIDGQRKSLDTESFLQRMSPRKPGSTWSEKNVKLAEQLIADGVMQPPGQAAIDAARANGRWDMAYAGSATMVIPDDFLAALTDSPDAKATYDTLNRSALFSIYLKLTTAKRPETRQRRLQALITTLALGERP